MPFEEFTQRKARTRFGYPTVTLLRSGGLSLNKAAYELLKEPATVVLAFDKEEQKIGVRPGRQQEEHAYVVNHVSDDSYWVAAQGFLKFYGIRVPLTTRYEAAMDSDYLATNLKAEPVHQEKRTVRTTDK